MKQLPNLLKQESSAASTLINVLLRMYRDPRDAHQATRGGVLDRLVPLGTEITRDFIAIDAETQPRNITAWSPVVADILRGACDFNDAAFDAHLATLYPLVTDLLLREQTAEMRLAIRGFYQRVGKRCVLPQGKLEDESHVADKAADVVAEGEAAPVSILDTEAAQTS